MKNKNTGSVLVLFLFVLLTACQKSDNSNTDKQPVAASDYYVLDITASVSAGKTFLNVGSYQQTTEYTCGPAAVVSLLKHYGKDAAEMTIAAEMGTSITCGTTPSQMTDWLNSHGFVASWSQQGELEMLRENLKNNTPTLVEWSDWGGHWVLVVGYDTRNTDDPMDDVIIFADPYDRHDDKQDGYTWFNAQRFYYMWYDALLFGSVMKRVYITATPI